MSTFIKNRDLISILLTREVAYKFKGSFLGVLWMVLTPIILIVIFTFIFGEVFEIKWMDIPESKEYFALILFSGLMVFNFFAESITKAPLLFISNSNYIKKILFPLEILPIVSVLSSSVQLIISFIVWIIFYLMIVGIPSINVLLLPIITLPFVFILFGLTFLFSTIGVFIRDTNNIISLITTLLLFLSPIFYPISVIPEKYQLYIYLNPVAYQIELTRNLMMWGNTPNLASFLIYFTLAYLFYLLTIKFFKKNKDRFIDVL
tara:strand:- start:1325 stop:2110 length:786 start_codon:yes stop_codon:yes gene_type:complete